MRERNGAFHGFFVGLGVAPQETVPRIAAKADQFTPGQALGARQVLRKVGHLASKLTMPPVTQRALIEMDRAPSDRLLLCHQLDERRLAGTIMANQAIHFAFVKRVLDGVEDGFAIDFKRGVFDLEHGRLLVANASIIMLPF